MAVVRSGRQPNLTAAKWRGGCGVVAPHDGVGAPLVGRGLGELRRGSRRRGGRIVVVTTEGNWSSLVGGPECVSGETGESRWKRRHGGGDRWKRRHGGGIAVWISAMVPWTEWGIYCISCGGEPRWVRLFVQCVATVMRWHGRRGIRLGTAAF
jgi:hypothetical protein